VPADRVVLGSDLARRSYWRPLGGGPGLDYLLTRFVPRLTAEGLAEVARRALVDNAARAFTLTPQG
jgi:5-phospho-D-xylono-1,4-lactonase